MVIKALFSVKNVERELGRNTLSFHLILRRFSKAMVSLSQSKLSKGSPVSQKAVCCPHIPHPMLSPQISDVQTGLLPILLPPPVSEVLFQSVQQTLSFLLHPVNSTPLREETAVTSEKLPVVG